MASEREATRPSGNAQTREPEADGSQETQDRAPARQNGDGHTPAQENEQYRSANNYVLHYDEDDATSGKIPDVLLDVPVLKVDEIDLEVDGLRAQVNVSADVLQLANLNVGVDARLGKLKLNIQGVEAQVLLKARLDNVKAVLDRVMTTIDRNPQIIEKLAEGVGSAVQDVGSGTGSAVGGVGSGAGGAVQELGEGAGSAAEDVGSGAGQAAQQVGEGAGQATRAVGQVAGEATGEAGQAVDQASGTAQRPPQEAGEAGEESGGQTVKHTVDDQGYITETTLNENGEVVYEDEVGNVADLPVEDEYIDDEGRAVSRVRDDSGNAYEMVLDDEGNMAEARAA